MDDAAIATSMDGGRAAELNPAARTGRHQEQPDSFGVDRFRSNANNPPRNPIVCQNAAEPASEGAIGIAPH